MNELFHPAMMPHLERLLPERHPVMQEMEDYAKEVNFPIIGPIVGQFCYLLTRLSGARRVFELGSGYGYSTAWFAMGVRDNGGGEVHHVVWNEDLSQKAKGYLKRLELDSLVQFHVSEAVSHLQQTEGQFDLMFNDIDKPGYPDSIAVIKPRLKPGGLLLMDNILWHGRIFDPNDQSDATQGILKATQMLFEDPDFTCSIIPLRDGVIVARKK